MSQTEEARDNVIQLRPEENSLTTESIPIQFPITPQEILEMAPRYELLKFDTPAAYREGVKAIAVVRTARTGVEKRRKELNADAIAFKRRVDSAAAELTEALEFVENGLKAKKQAVDDEKARIKAEEEAAERAKVEAELKAQREAEEAAARAQREAEQAKLDAQRAELEAQQEETRRQAEALAEEKRKLDAAREEIATEQRKLAEAKEAERIRLEKAQRAEEQRRAAEESERRRLARLEAIKPDAEKIDAFAQAILNALMSYEEMDPKVSSEEAQHVVKKARAQMNAIADELLDFAKEHT